MSLQRDLEAYMESLSIIDTHEHLPAFEAKRHRYADVLQEYGLAYMQSHLAVAGMGCKRYQKEIMESVLPVKEKWHILEPYWEKCRYTGFGQYLDATVRILYGIPRIDGETIEEVNRHYLDSFRQDHYERVLKKTCHIETSLLDTLETAADPRFFRRVPRIDFYIYIPDFEKLAQFEENCGHSIRNLKQLENALETYIRDNVKKGAVAFKLGIAIFRSLAFEKVSFDAAERAFNRLIVPEGRIMPEPWNRKFTHTEPDLENYMLHKALSVLNELKMPLQIHTGMQAWTGNYLSNSNPQLLTPLFSAYPDIRFDLFHIGYPYQHAMIDLGKSNPNVYVNLVWAHVLSPKATADFLDEWLESMPAHKLIGFGADSCFIDGVAGQRWMAIHNIAGVLEKKAEQKVFSEQKAFNMAKAFLYDNPRSLYRIS